jgi:hypothetical protein
MTIHTTLSKLTYEDFGRASVWMSVGEYEDDEDTQLEPAPLTAEGLVPEGIGEVWCLASARFADGSEHKAAAMCRGDAEDGPLACSVWNGREDVPVLLPPAPPHVLEVDGPLVFARKFGLGVSEVFPIDLEVFVRFQRPPRIRRVRLRESGAEPA